MKSSHFIYILLCADKSLYTGYAVNVENRILEHEKGSGSKYVRSKLPIKLIYTEEFPTKVAAMKREFEIKSWPREKKIEELKLDFTHPPS